MLSKPIFEASRTVSVRAAATLPLVCAICLASGCALRGPIVLASHQRATDHHPMTSQLVGSGADDRLLARVAGGVPAPLEFGQGYSLSLSGGGYRAMLFHLGAIRRLNDLGKLKDVRVVCAVSGGSITAAMLGLRWDALEFDQSTGRAQNFFSEVAEPIRALAGETIDFGPALTRLFSLGTRRANVVGALDREIFRGSTLGDFSGAMDGPLVVIHATEFSWGFRWTFSRDFSGQSAMNRYGSQSWPVAVAVGASAAFPAVLGPIDVRIETGAESQVLVSLIDGGVHDNLAADLCGLSSLHLVSSAELPPDYSGQPVGSSLFSVLSHTVDLIHGTTSKATWKRACGLAIKNSGNAPCWSYDSYFHDTSAPFSRDEMHALLYVASIPTRLEKIGPRMQCFVEAAGYFAAAHSLSSHSSWIGKLEDIDVLMTFPCIADLGSAYRKALLAQQPTPPIPNGKMTRRQLSASGRK